MQDALLMEDVNVPAEQTAQTLSLKGRHAAATRVPAPQTRQRLRLPLAQISLPLVHWAWLVVRVAPEPLRSGSV